MTRAVGCDVSHWDGDTDFQKMVSSGASFVFIKASQNSEDKKFTQNWKNAKEAGILRGAYHYLDWKKSEIEQANLFADTMRGDYGELPPVLDLEEDPAPYKLSKQSIQTKVWNFLQTLERKTGKIPMIYCGYYYWKDFCSTELRWAKYPFWLAWYADESVIKVPAPWTKWTFWQYTSKGNSILYGSKKKVIDLNYYNGTEAELREWSSGNTPPPSVVTTKKYITTGTVNLRESPDSSGDIIGTIPSNMVIEVDRVEQYYVHILYPNVGWIYSSYVKPIDEQTYKVCPTCNGTGKVLN